MEHAGLKARRYERHAGLKARYVLSAGDRAQLFGRARQRTSPPQHIGPEINLLFYYGVLGARAAWRRQAVPAGVVSPPPQSGPPERGTTGGRRPAGRAITTGPS